MTRYLAFAALVLGVAVSLAGAAAQVAPLVPIVPPTPVPPLAAPLPPTATNEPAPPPAMAANPNNVTDPMATKDLNQIICVQEKLTGSMLPSRVCQTRRAWIRMGVDSRDIIDHAQRVGSGQPGGG
jgi:hypothetical protein